jgi:hypothetical protein
MAKTYQGKCTRCGLVLTTDRSTAPDNKAAGPCPKDTTITPDGKTRSGAGRGEHSWRHT